MYSIRIPRTGCVACLKPQPFDMKKEEKNTGPYNHSYTKGNPSLQTLNEINASLQKLLRGNNVFLLKQEKLSQKRAIT